MANPFKKIIKNTEESEQASYKKDMHKESSIETKTCPNCGAPRPRRTDLRRCDYCGYEYMNINEKINPDK